ncbi:hypothetical protein [Streptomyces coffeae]|uniref:ATP-binding protein n=1 Tax=Streptomyces coffeae TaxID=621382 RepID=A0ABS1NFK0_9ACTN|nr:hypothetical protein [Streptomyces coffeae]MBL1098869.1 hypothetical protein [Streptomyces coffeae]
MNLHQLAAQRRTLVVESCDGVIRDRLLTGLAENHGYTVGRAPRELPHIDPVRPYREILQQGGALAVDAHLVGELVYGPLRRGHSRVTWIQAYDFADALAERRGAFVHVRAPVAVLEERMAARRGPAVDLPEIAAAVAAFEGAFRTLAQHAPVVTVDEDPLTGPGTGPPDLTIALPVSPSARRLPRIRSPVSLVAQPR